MMLRKRNPKYSFVTLGLDSAVVVGAYLFAYWFRFSGIVFSVMDIPPLGEYIKALVVILPTIVFVFRQARLYSVRSPLATIDEFFAVIRAMTLVFLILMAITFLYREFSYSRLVIVITWLTSIACILLGRFLIRRAEAKARIDGKQQRLLVVGINRHARKLIKRYVDTPRYGYELVGVLAETEESLNQHLEGVSIIGTIDDFDRLVAEKNVDEVVLANPSLSREQTAELMLKCESRMVTFRLVADFYGMVTSCVEIEYVGDVPLLGLKELPLDDVWNRIAKRSFDIVSSACGICLVSPLLILLALLVKQSSPGPIFYVQERTGQDGRSFPLFKFRTMRKDAEDQTGPMWAKEKDDRTTKIGSLLRRTNLDELPQLFNVLMGHMSLVGPRPERPHFVEQFKDSIPRYMTRHVIKAGITGWAQVNGYRGNTSLKERVKYDLYYMENWSLLLDIKILIMTLAAFKNAY